jgi:hypothetical protein
MMRLILAPKSMKGIEEKLKPQDQKSAQKSLKIMKMKNGATHRET